jgi:hypothetical protein
LDPDVVSECDVTTATGVDPQAPSRFVESRVHTAESIRWWSPVLTRRLGTLLSDPGLERLPSVELLVPEAVCEQFRAEVDERFTALLKCPDCQVRCLPETPPVGLLLCDDAEVVVLIYGPEGVLEGLLSTTTGTAVEWAEARLDEARSESSPVTEN